MTYPKLDGGFLKLPHQFAISFAGQCKTILEITVCRLLQTISDSVDSTKSAHYNEKACILPDSTGLPTPQSTNLNNPKTH